MKYIIYKCAPCLEEDFPVLYNDYREATIFSTRCAGCKTMGKLGCDYEPLIEDRFLLLREETPL